MDGGQFLAQVFAQQAHQKGDFGLGAAPVFQRKSVQGEGGNMQPGAGLNDGARRLHTGAMAGNARQMAALRPAAVAVHDDGNMARQAARVKLFQQARLITICRLQ